MIKQMFKTMYQTSLRSVILTKSILIISNHTYYLMEIKIRISQLNNGKYIQFNLSDYYIL